MNEPVKYIHELPSGQFEYVSDVKLIEELLIKPTIQCTALTIGTCEDNICYDSPGWPYDSRKCIRCGRGSLI